MTRLYTAMDIVEATGKTKQSVYDRLKPLGGTGRGRKYDYDHLPADYQRALDDWEHRRAHAGAVLPAPTLQTLLAPASSAAGALPAAKSNAAAGLSTPKKRADGAFVTRGQIRKPKAENALDDKDRAYRDNALILCRTVDTAMALADCSEKRAIVELATRLVGGDVKDELLAAARATYLKPRKNAGPLGGLSAQISRLQHMMAFYRAGLTEGDAGKYLIAGRVQKTGQKPEDIAAFLRHYCRPCRPPVSEAWKNAAGWYAEHGFKQPSVHVFRRIAQHLPVTLKYRGRMTGAAYRALLPYISRDVSMFKANDLWVGDGHTFKARVKSPLTGKAFRPEVTVILDWVSRKIVGWSVDLAESTVAVSAAFRHAQMQTRARPLVYYSDKGSGQTGKKIDHPVTGTAARQGFDHQTGIPGNPQGRGVIERLWPSVLMTLARSYPTFLTKDGDRDEIRKVGQALAKADRAGEDSPLLPSFEQFVADLAACVEAYNGGHNHSALGGKTPNEVYAEKLDPTSIAFGVDDDEIRALWMPEDIRTHQRGVVSLYNNTYFRADLVDRLAEGEQIRVRFDIHDARQVWLYRMDGSEIGPAEFEGNKRAAFPVSYIEQKRDERADGIIARARKEIERAEAERALTLEAEAERVPEIVKWIEPKPEAVEAAPEKTLLDFLPAAKPAEKEYDHEETMAMFATWFGKKPEGDAETPSKEAAAG